MLAVINDTGMVAVLVAVVLLFGASRIPKLARNLGEASREFKKAHDDLELGPPAPAPSRSETVTMTRDQLDALLAGSASRPAGTDTAGTGS